MCLLKLSLCFFSFPVVVKENAFVLYNQVKISGDEKTEQHIWSNYVLQNLQIFIKMFCFWSLLFWLPRICSWVSIISLMNDASLEAHALLFKFSF